MMMLVMDENDDIDVDYSDNWMQDIPIITNPKNESFQRHDQYIL